MKNRLEMDHEIEYYRVCSKKNLLYIVLVGAFGLREV